MRHDPGIVRGNLQPDQHHSRRTPVSPRFYKARTRTEETCIRLTADVESLTWVCQLAVRADAMPLDKMMK